MLINLSNHPSANWSEEQIEAAKLQFDEIVDLQFPQINPHWNLEQVEEFAGEFFMDFLKDCEFGKYDKKNLTVHIMGELTFCYLMINMFKIKNIKCVASTTERIVIEEIDGKKTAQFRFVQFRDYL